MTVRRWAAAASAVAGIVVLAGPGWALLTAGAVLYVLPDTVAPARARSWLRGAYGRARGLLSSRRTMAA
jgi:hypothetical protein